MTKLATFALLATLALVLACSCSGDDGTGEQDQGATSDAATDAPAADVANGDTGTPPDVAETSTPDAAPPIDATVDIPKVVDPKCESLKAGTNTGFDVDGKARTFLLHLPERASVAGPWPVVFNWHGFGDTAANMAFLLSGHVNDASYPFILVTPDDLGALPPNGMDWEIIKLKSPPTEARLFDEVLTCLDQKYGVDRDRVHSVGFSAGAIACDLLGVVRGEQLASVVSFSGTYFSNPPNKEALANFAALVTWPEMTAGATFTQLLVHGGPSDNYPLGTTTLRFDENGKRDVPYLNGLGHDVVHCDHGGGHTIPQWYLQGQIVRFFEAHPRGVTTTWADSGVPAAASLPAYCVGAPAL